MEIVASIKPRKSPIYARLVLVVSGTVFGKDTVPVRGHDRVQIGSMIVPSMLHDYRLRGRSRNTLIVSASSSLTRFKGAANSGAPKRERR